MPAQMDVTPDVLDLVLYAGDVGDFEISFVDDLGSPVSVNQYTWSAQIRKSRGSTQYIDLPIDSTQASSGILIIGLPSAITSTLGENLWNRNSQWDLQCTDIANRSVTVLQGSVYCSQDVTR
jgi:hypothetical protein